MKTIVTEEKSMVPAIVSIPFPGLGHLISGKFIQGIAFFLATIIGYFCLIVPGICIHLTCIWAASRIKTTKKSVIQEA